MDKKTEENKLRYPTTRCMRSVRHAADVLATSGDYQKALGWLELRAKSRPRILAIRFGALCGLLEERLGHSGLDAYIRFSNWVLSKTKES